MKGSVIPTHKEDLEFNNGFYLLDPYYDSQIF